MLGVVPGLLAGYYRGATDTVISRVIDVTLAFPILLLALGIASSCSLGNGCAGGLIKPGLTTVIVAIVVVNWTYIGRIIRGQVLSMREKEFVEAARAAGAGSTTILFRELLPNLVAPIVVYSTLVIPQNILLEAALSYLGVGINPPQASWGEMLAEATPIFATAWWFFAFPGLALLLTVLAFNLLGDGIRDALDPESGMTKPDARRRSDVSTHIGPSPAAPPCVAVTAALLTRGRRRALGAARRADGRDRQAGGTITVLSAGDVDHIDPGQAYYSFTYEITYATQRPLLVVPAEQRSTRSRTSPRRCRRSRTAGRRSPCTSARASASARPSTAR